MATSQQQQQTTLKMKPTKIGNTSKQKKEVLHGMDDPYWRILPGDHPEKLMKKTTKKVEKKMPEKMAKMINPMKKTVKKEVKAPSKEKVMKSIRKTMGYK